MSGDAPKTAADQPETDPPGSATDTGTGDEAGDGAGTDVRAAFREALARKNKRHQDMHADAADLERSKAGGPHGPAGGKRTFRRKSG